MPARTSTATGARVPARTSARGKATYGYYPGGSGYPYYPYYPYYPWYPGWDYGWYPGWDWYFGWGWSSAWGYPAAYYYPYASGRAVWVSDVDGNVPAMIETDVEPGKAELRIDGEPRGRARDYDGTWDVLYLAPGPHALEFRRDGFQSLRIELDAQPGARYRLADQLVEGTGTVTRVESSGPPPADRAEPPPEAAPEFDWAITPSSGPEEEGALRRGLLRISASPGDAVVYLDGEILARADALSRLHGALPVAAGPHVVEVVRPGYATERVEVLVAEGRPARVEVALEREPAP